MTQWEPPHENLPQLKEKENIINMKAKMESNQTIQLDLYNYIAFPREINLYTGGQVVYHTKLLGE